MKGIELIENFNSTCPNSKDTPSPRMVATVGAGVQDGEMVETLAARNALAVSGTSNVSFPISSEVFMVTDSL